MSEMNMRCEGCGEVADSPDGMLSHKCKPNTPASDQPEYRPLGPDEVIRTSEKVEFRYRSYYPSAWEIPPAENKFEGQLVRDWPSYEFRRPIAAEKREDTRTCGEISCDECNERYQKAVAEISTLQQQLAQVQKLNDIMHKFSVFCHSKTCVNHTDAERKESGCPVCLQKQLAQEKEARVKAEMALRIADVGWPLCRQDRDNLREALRPVVEKFMERAKRYAKAHSDWFDKMPGHWTTTIELTMDQGRAARAALQQSEGK